MCKISQHVCLPFLTVQVIAENLRMWKAGEEMRVQDSLLQMREQCQFRLLKWKQMDAQRLPRVQDMEEVTLTIIDT